MNTALLKRIALILGFIVIIIAVAFGIWFLFFAPIVQLPTNQNANVNATTSQLPNVNVNRTVNENVNQPIVIGPTTLPQPAEVANGDLTLATRIADQSVQQATISTDGSSLLYYDEFQGKFFRINPETGELTALSDQRFPEVENVTWSPDATRAVLEFPDESKVVYDFAQQQQYTLPREAQDFSFSADSDGLAYEFIGSSPDEEFLVTADVDGSNLKAVAKITDQADNVQVAWSPNDQVVGLFRKGINQTQQEVILLGQNQENFKSITTSGRGFDGRWTPDGSKLLYTVYSEETNWNPELHLVFAEGDITGSGDVNIGLQTFLSKCTFNRRGNTAYCAVPDFLERGSGIHPEFAFGVYDALYVIDLTTGAVHPLANPVTDGYDRFTIRSVYLTPDEGTLYFVDSNTGLIHEVRLR